MLTYNPDRAPVPEEWLAVDEQERIDAVLRWHRKARVELPSELLHAIMHSVVENQLAEKMPCVFQAIPRLMQQGLTRHDAVHAVASVLSQYIFDLTNSPQPPTDQAISHATYEAAVDRLTAEAWRSLAQ